jgi:uncharacterized membrane protein YvlD (DUF360 family)
MTLLVVKILARIVIFGIALTFACRRDGDVKVEPRNKLPLVAGVFALLNTLLYSLLAGILNLSTLWLLFFVVPFVANGLLLMLTDKLLKSFRIDSITALAKTAEIVTVGHLLLRIANL